jgi:hypothetical protein
LAVWWFPIVIALIASAIVTLVLMKKDMFH